MRISVVDPIDPAIKVVKHVLFQPFDIGKWFVVGLAAWVATLGQRGGSYGGNWGSGSNGQQGLETFAQWFREHMSTIILVGMILLAVIIGLTVLIAWLKSRMAFVFLDQVARNSINISEPWRRYRDQGNGIFAVRLVLTAIGWVLTLIILVLVFVALMDAIDRNAFDFAFIGLVVLFCLPAVPIFILLGIAAMLIDDLLVPAMYKHNVGVREGWWLLRSEIFAGRFGQMVLYVLMRWLISICIGFIVFIGTCLTCCIAALPYIGVVILLPVYVFVRAYPLCFLRQFGERWDVFRQDADDPDGPYQPPEIGPTSPYGSETYPPGLMGSA